MCTYVLTHACMFGGQRSLLAVFFYHSAFCFYICFECVYMYEPTHSRRSEDNLQTQFLPPTSGFPGSNSVVRLVSGAFTGWTILPHPTWLFFQNRAYHWTWHSLFPVGKLFQLAPRPWNLPGRTLGYRCTPAHQPSHGCWGLQTCTTSTLSAEPSPSPWLYFV